MSDWAFVTEVGGHLAAASPPSSGSPSDSEGDADEMLTRLHNSSPTFVCELRADDTAVAGGPPPPVQGPGAGGSAAGRGEGAGASASPAGPERPCVSPCSEQGGPAAPRAEQLDEADVGSEDDEGPPSLIASSVMSTPGLPGARGPGEAACSGSHPAAGAHAQAPPLGAPALARCAGAAPATPPALADWEDEEPPSLASDCSEDGASENEEGEEGEARGEGDEGDERTAGAEGEEGEEEACRTAWEATARKADAIRLAGKAAVDVQPVSRTGHLSILVVGEAGVGKTAFMSNLLAPYICTEEAPVAPPSPPPAAAAGDGPGAVAGGGRRAPPRLVERTAEGFAREDGQAFHYTVWETQGFECTRHEVQALVRFVKGALRAHLAAEQDPLRAAPLEDLPDARPDVCLFLLPPHGFAFRHAAAAAELAKHLPVVPLLARADALEPRELCELRAGVREALGLRGVALAGGAGWGEGLLAEEGAGLGLVGAALPAAVAAAHENDDSVGRCWPVRWYPWGVCEVLSEFDTLAIRRLLLERGYHALKAATARRYLAYRTKKLAPRALRLPGEVPPGGPQAPAGAGDGAARAAATGPGGGDPAAAAGPSAEAGAPGADGGGGKHGKARRRGKRGAGGGASVGAAGTATGSTSAGRRRSGDSSGAVVLAIVCLLGFWNMGVSIWLAHGAPSSPMARNAAPAAPWGNRTTVSGANLPHVHGRAGSPACAASLAAAANLSSAGGPANGTAPHAHGPPAGPVQTVAAAGATHLAPAGRSEQGHPSAGQGLEARIERLELESVLAALQHDFNEFRSGAVARADLEVTTGHLVVLGARDLLPEAAQVRHMLGAVGSLGELVERAVHKEVARASRKLPARGPRRNGRGGTRAMETDSGCRRPRLRLPSWQRAQEAVRRAMESVGIKLEEVDGGGLHMQGSGQAQRRLLAQLDQVNATVVALQGRVRGVEAALDEALGAQDAQVAVIERRLGAVEESMEALQQAAHAPTSTASSSSASPASTTVEAEVGGGAGGGTHQQRGRGKGQKVVIVEAPKVHVHGSASASADGHERKQKVVIVEKPHVDVWYFLANAACVMLLPFINLFYRQLGFSPQQIGLLCALKPWVSAAAGAGLLSLADSHKIHFAVLLATFFVQLLGRSLIPSVTSFLFQTVLALLTEAAAMPLGTLVDAAVSAAATDEGGYGRARLWASVGWGGTAPLAGAVAAHAGLRTAFLCYSVVMALTLLPTLLLPVQILSGGSAGKTAEQTGAGPGNEAAAAAEGGGKPDGGAPDAPPVALVRKRERQDSDVVASREGSTRQAPSLELLGPKAGAGTVCSPGLEHQWSIAATPRTASPPAAILAIGTAADVPAAPLSLPWRQTTTAGMEALSVASMGGSPVGAGAPGAPAVAAAGVWAGLRALLSDLHVALFFFLAFLGGFGNGSIGYLFLFLDEIGGDGTLMGLCLATNCAAEVPVFYFSGQLIQWLGVERALNLGMAAYVLRLCCYVALPLAPSPYFVLGAELLQGCTFALLFSAGTWGRVGPRACTVNVKRIAPPHLRSTTQSLFAGLYGGVGAGLGGLVGGMLYGALGARTMFAASSILILTGWLAATGMLALATWQSAGYEKVGALGEDEEQGAGGGGTAQP
eukprot:scaffold7.g3417.t1